MSLVSSPLRRLFVLPPETVESAEQLELESDAVDLLTERWRAASSPTALSPRQLDAFYRVKRFIPRSVQLAARRILARRQIDPAFPKWPYDDSIATLARTYGAAHLRQIAREEMPFPWFWPDGTHCAFVITHDVESEEGLRRAPDLADLEEARGFRSSFNIVADWYPVDPGVVRDLEGRGFEIGVHGVHHDRSLFATRDAFDSQLPQLHEAARRFGAVGFRSPATHRVLEWLPELPFEYDCTVPHSDPFEPQPGGCCSPWPFFLGGLVELPYTLPQDHTLFTLLGRRDSGIWLEQVERIARVNGLVQSVTHPDPGYLGDTWRRDVFAEFLDAMRERTSMWHALPREVARWWRARDAGDVEGIRAGTLRADPSLLAVFIPPI